MDSERQELEYLRRRVVELEEDNQRDGGRERLMALFDHMFEGVQIIGYEYQYLYLNKAAAEHGKIPRDELIGKRMADAYPGIDDTEMFDKLRQCMSERTPQRLTNHFSYPDGHKGWFDLRFTPIPAGVLVFSADVTDQKESELSARQHEEDLATTLECMTEGLMTTDLDGRVVRMNSAAEVITGWSKTEAATHPVDDLVKLIDQKTNHAIDRPIGRLVAEEVNFGMTDEVLLVTRDGTQTPVAFSSAPLSSNGGPVRGAVIAIKDLAEEYRLNTLLRQAQKMEAIGSLAGGIAHDFNNYLSVISGYCDMVADKVADDGETLDDLEQIRDAASKATSLTSQLLAFSRQKVLKPEVISLNEVVINTEKLLKRLIGEDIEFVTKLGGDIDPVEFDPTQIEQIIINLIVNARDAMPRGGRLAVETRNAMLDEDYANEHPGAQAGPHVMLSVSDNGHGMDAHTRSRIFDPFFTTKPTSKGTGLGLSTVYGIVKQSGGNIWVYSEVGHGTTFKIYLPRAEQAASRSRQPRMTRELHGSETILIVEDDDPLRRLLERILSSSGYQTLATGDPHEALTICEQHKGPIDMMLTDVVMPGMDGAQLSREVARLRPNTKVVFMSGYTDDAIAHRGVLDENTAFIEKPVNREQLLAQIRGYF